MFTACCSVEVVADTYFCLCLFKTFSLYTGIFLTFSVYARQTFSQDKYQEHYLAAVNITITVFLLLTPM